MRAPHHRTVSMADGSDSLPVTDLWSINFFQMIFIERLLQSAAALAISIGGLLRGA